MFSIWKKDECRHWIARITDRYGEERDFTLCRHPLPVCPKSMEKKDVLHEVGILAATEYFQFLHSQNEWKLLEVRNYDLRRMYNTRMADFHKFYSIENFRYDLNQIGIKPAEPAQVKQTQSKINRTYKSTRFRNRKYKYGGREKTLKEWSAECGISDKVLGMRIKRGWTLERAIKTSVMTQSEGGAIGADRRWKKK